MKHHIGRRQFLAGTVAGLCGTLRGKSVAAAPEIPEAVEELVTQFREDFEIPGVSVAMSHRGRIGFAAGFGMADKDENLPVTPDHQFRVASISKPITAVTIFRLIERRQLQLTDLPFANEKLLAGLLDNLDLPAEHLASIQAISVQHLLEHTSGGWSNAVRDPVFVGSMIDHDHQDLIRETFRTFPPEDAPGTTYRYSNFGFCILGRIIEAVSGKTYEETVRELVLQPSGAEEMRVGQREAENLPPHEVHYYGQNENPYHRIMHVARMDSFGGWVATPTQLLRVAHHCDGFPTVRDLLNSKSLTRMTTPSTANEFYACGWNVNKAPNWWHVGSFSGGSGIFVRTHDQYCWAILCNSRSKKSGYINKLDTLGWDIRKALS